MQHIIKKQTIQLTVDKKLDAFHVQQRMSELYMQKMLPVLGKLFDDASGEDKIIYIDSLEIDLGAITEEELGNKSWEDAFIMEIAGKCKEKLTAGASAQQVSVQTEKKTLSICRQWIFYMQKGYLPWNVLQIKPAWKQEVLEALAVEYASVEAVRSLIRSDAKAVGRIVEQHTETFLLQLMEVMTAGKRGDVPEMLNELVEILHTTVKSSKTAGSTSKIRLRKQLWCRVLLLTAEYKERAGSSLIGEAILQEYLSHPAKLQEIRPGLLNKLRVLLPIIKAWKEKAADHPYKQGKRPVSAPETPERLADREKADSAEQQGSPFHQKQEESIQGEETASPAEKEALIQKENDTSSKKQHPLPDFPKDPFEKLKNTDSGLLNKGALTDEEGLFVAYAGVILVHPFLSLFFNRLKLLREGKFTDILSHQKALYLLHYLTTGETSAEECELVIPKVLTAYPLEEPVEKNILLSNGEREEADHLLQEVIRQWNKLKNTSPDELRGGFLQRRAKLYTKNDSLHLQFEAEAIDILLDYLPWNLSIIKLPWMQDFLRVEWR